jgi:hypothetical protein
MKDSRNLAMMFLLGAFLSGGVLGFTANRYLNRERVCSIGELNTPLISIMSQRLHLSKAQQLTVDSVLNERWRQSRILVAPIRPQLDSLKLNAREQIRRVLSAEQNEGFTDLIRQLSDTTRKDHED